MWISKNSPGFTEAIFVIAASSTFGLSSLYLLGYLKRLLTLKTGHTRKLFHFTIFISAALFQLHYGLDYLYLFGIGVSLSIFFTLFKGDGFAAFESLAREHDAPYKKLYIIIPYLSTLIGGLCANFFFGKLALVGYLVCGLGDAFGEIIGISFGRHRYRTLLSIHSSSYKTLEGSLAVFTLSSAAMFYYFHLVNETFTFESLITGFSVGLVATIVEAVSPRGMDNLTMQLLPTWCYVIIIH